MVERSSGTNPSKQARPQTSRVVPDPLNAEQSRTNELALVGDEIVDEPAAMTAAPVGRLFADRTGPNHSAAGQARTPAGLRPHEIRMASRYTSFEAAFSHVLGKSALDELMAQMTTRPIVLIAGDQCTGKGTAAAGVVEKLGGSNSGTGTVLRALAKENGLTIEQMSALLSGKAVEIEDKNGVAGPRGGVRTVTLSSFSHLGTSEDVDVRLDFRAAQAIAQGELQKADGSTLQISVFESRLAGHLGSFLEELGRKNVVSVYLVAGPKVQAERYLEREVFRPAEANAQSDAESAAVVQARQKARAVLDALPEHSGLGACLEALVKAGIEKVDTIKDEIAGIAGRDENDRTRLLGLYGVNYQDRSAFDVVIDTNGKTPAEVQQAILDAVRKKTQQASADASA